MGKLYINFHFHCDFCQLAGGDEQGWASTGCDGALCPWEAVSEPCNQLGVADWWGAIGIGLPEPLSSVGYSLMPGTLVVYCCCFLCSGSALVTAEVLEHLCVTCPKQYKIAEILCFSLYENTFKCGRERRSAKASMRFLSTLSFVKDCSFSCTLRPASSWLLCPLA